MNKEVKYLSMKIPEETVNMVRDRANIADVVSQYVQLKKRGKNLFGFCPFHDERTGSFTVTEEKQIFHCFSCGRGGNVFTFLMEVEGFSFPEAVIKTAELSQIELDESIINSQYSQSQTSDSKSDKLVRMHEAASELFHHILLNTAGGEKALHYLEERGLSRKTIETFKIGFAPGERTMLRHYLSDKAFENALLEESGLFVKRDNGDLLDRFYQRIIFPIRNQQGKTVAFSGRIFQTDQLDDAGPKYLNSPETYLFNKRAVLFNYDLARSAIRRANEVILFEGFMDVIAAWQAGVENGVASMGTSLTNEQIMLLDRATDHVLIAYDGDSAGVEAAKRAADLLSSETHFNVEIVSFPGGLDPDEFIKRSGPKAFNDLLNHGRNTLFSFKMNYYRRSLNLDNESERIRYIDTVLNDMVTITSAVEREMYLKQLADEFELSIDSLKEQFQQLFYDHRNAMLKNKKNPRESEKNLYKQPPAQFQKKSRHIDVIERAEQLLLNRLFHFEEAWIHLKSLPEEFHFVHDEYQMLYLLFDSFREHNGNNAAIDAFIDFVNEPELKNKLVEIELLSINPELTVRELEDYIDLISRKSILQSQLKEKKDAMTEASKRGDQEQLRKLMIEVVNLSRLLKNSQ